MPPGKDPAAFFCDLRNTVAGRLECHRQHETKWQGKLAFFGAPTNPMKYSVGDLSIDTGPQAVSRDGAPIALPKLSYDLLLVLVRAAPNLVSLDELMRLVWPGIVVSPETVSQRIKLLRDALDDDPRKPHR